MRNDKALLGVALVLLDTPIRVHIEEPSQEGITRQEILVAPGSDPLPKCIALVLHRGCHPPTTVGAERQSDTSAVAWIGDCLDQTQACKVPCQAARRASIHANRLRDNARLGRAEMNGGHYSVDNAKPLVPVAPGNDRQALQALWQATAQRVAPFWREPPLAMS